MVECLLFSPRQPKRNSSRVPLFSLRQPKRNSSRVPAYQNSQGIVGFCDSLVEPFSYDWRRVWVEVPSYEGGSRVVGRSLYEEGSSDYWSPFLRRAWVRWMFFSFFSCAKKRTNNVSLVPFLRAEEMNKQCLLWFFFFCCQKKWMQIRGCRSTPWWQFSNN